MVVEASHKVLGLTGRSCLTCSESPGKDAFKFNRQKFKLQLRKMEQKPQWIIPAEKPIALKSNMSS